MKISVAATLFLASLSLVSAQVASPEGNNLRRIVTPRQLQSDTGCGTPDCETPPTEDICDQYDHIQNGKGLCNAFCEAKDCDTAEYQETKGCVKIKEQFVAKTGESSLPCESRCPCWDDPNFMAADTFGRDGYVTETGNAAYNVWIKAYLSGFALVPAFTVKLIRASSDPNGVEVCEICLEGRPCTKMTVTDTTAFQKCRGDVTDFVNSLNNQWFP